MRSKFLRQRGEIGDADARAVGGVEAVLAAGLTVICIPAHLAVPEVFLFRMSTFWLPIPVGWLCFEVLQRRGVL